MAATDWDDELAYFSNYGLTSVDLGAPGSYVLSTYLDIWYTPELGDLFFDDMESGNGNWSAEGTWAITDEQALSPTHAWSDSPGGNYVKNTEYALTSNPIDLSGESGSLCLGFAAKHELEKDYDSLEIYYKAPFSPSLWAITDENAYGGTHAWSDSPGGNYPDNANSWLVSPVINVLGAEDSVGVRFRQTGKLENGFDPTFFDTDVDTDNDGITDFEEILIGTNTTNNDTDSDGVGDYDEIKIHRTNATNNDTDGDNLSDFAKLFRYHQAISLGANVDTARGLGAPS